MAAGDGRAGDGRAGNGTRALVAAAAFVIVVAGMKAAQPIVVPFLLSVFLAVITAPALVALTRRGVPTWLSLILVVGVLMASLVGLAMLVATPLGQFLENRDDLLSRMEVFGHQLQTWVDGLPFLGPDEHGKPAFVIADSLEPKAMFSYVAEAVRNLGGLLSNSALILLTTIFLLLEASGLPTKLRAALRDPETLLADLEGCADDVNRYMSLKAGLSLLTGVSITLWLQLIGMPYAVLWGVLAFLLNFVPNIGSIVAAVPPLLVAGAQLDGSLALWTGVAFATVNTVVGTVIEPRVLGKGLGLSTLVVFLSLVFWGWVLGAIGMLLSIPLTMAVKLTLEGSEDLRWIAVLLGSGSDARTRAIGAGAAAVKGARIADSETTPRTP